MLKKNLENIFKHFLEIFWKFLQKKNYYWSISKPHLTWWNIHQIRKIWMFCRNWIVFCELLCSIVVKNCSYDIVLWFSTRHSQKIFWLFPTFFHNFFTQIFHDSPRFFTIFRDVHFYIFESTCIEVGCWVVWKMWKYCGYRRDRAMCHFTYILHVCLY